MSKRHKRPVVDICLYIVINDVKLSKKVNIVAKTPSTSKYINHFRFCSYREDGAKKLRRSSNSSSKSNSNSRTRFSFKENLIHKFSLN